MASSALMAAEVAPGIGLGPLILGASLHAIISRLKAESAKYPTLDLSYSSSTPIYDPIVLNLPINGIRLRFDGLDQRLRLIEVLDFSKNRLSYKEDEISKLALNSTSSQDAGNQVAGPTFRHVYNRLFGPSFPGEYIPPKEGLKRGTYVLSYPGIAFSFPLDDTAWVAGDDFVRVLSSSAASPASSMAIFNGESWKKARADLFSRIPEYPRSLNLDPRKGPAEIELVRVHGQGKIELLRRNAVPFWIKLSETTPQDLVTELGPPDAIYRKDDRRLTIHKTRTHGAGRVRTANGRSPDSNPDMDTDRSSAHTTTDDSSDEDRENSDPSGECFYNYFHHGFDVLISSPASISPAVPGATQNLDSGSARLASAELTSTKVLLHGNIPGSYSFNRHRRSRWTIEYASTQDDLSPLTSEMPFNDISTRLKEVWKSSYANEEEQRSMQRGMVVDRESANSPGSSVELLGGWEDDSKRKEVRDASLEGEQGLGNTELFGFPGVVFEVLKNGTVSCLTVF